MKKVILLLLPLLTIGLFNKLNAQCTPYNFQSTIKSLSVAGSTATATLDVSFDIKANNGNKYIFLHLWAGSDYSNVTINWGTNGQKAPSAADLNGPGGSHPTVYNLAIDNNVIPQTYKTTYVDGSLVLDKPVTPPSVTHLTNGADSFVIKDIIVSFPAIKLQTLGPIIQGIIWSSNANTYSTSTSVQCYLTGATFLADPVISGTSSCQNYTITVAHNSLIQNDILSGSYNVYVDYNLDGLYTPGTDLKITGPISFNIAATSPINTYFTGSQSDAGTIPTAYKGMNLFVVLTSGSASLTKFIPTFQCSSLPVSLKSFSASRNNQTVSLRWETASEQNNKGFYVQRNVNGEWKDIAFVFSSAEGGNSSSILGYAYNDLNTYQTISYYRLLQVDMDGKGKYSEVRTVKGTQTEAKLMLFPNPGTGGKINVMFSEETSSKDVLVYDANGRVVKSYKNVMTSNLTIQQLPVGVYSVQVKNNTTQTVSSEKFIIQN